MKKIAFITSSITDSNIPLSRELTNRGYSVDLYILVFKTQNQIEFSAFEIQHPQYGIGIHRVSISCAKGLSGFNDISKFRVFLIVNPGLGNPKRKIIHKGISLLHDILAWRNSLIIKSKKYDVINVIGHEEISIRYSIYLKKEKVIQTFHEVCYHLEPNQPLLPSLKLATRHRIPIILPSKHLYSIFISHFPDYPVYQIPFGILTSYSDFVDGQVNINVPSNYLLFLGNVLPYKGLNVLYDAFKILRNQGSDINIVVAGNGSSPVLEDMKNEKNITVLNRWIKNSEVAYLVSRCKAIICPYLSASQSALPHTAYVFDKPVVVTKVGAMQESVLDNKTGFIVEPNNPQLLAEKMKNILENVSLEKDLKLHKEEYIEEMGMNWSVITDSFVSCINSL